jgi:hypothetical protein
MPRLEPNCDAVATYMLETGLLRNPIQPLQRL